MYITEKFTLPKIKSYKIEKKKESKENHRAYNNEGNSKGRTQGFATLKVTLISSNFLKKTYKNYVIFLFY